MLRHFSMEANESILYESETFLIIIVIVVTVIIVGIVGIFGIVVAATTVIPILLDNVITFDVRFEKCNPQS